MGITVLSLFDGISCGRLALERAGIEVDTYYASEIDKYAIDITQYNRPDTIQLGDVTKIDFTQFKGKIDLLIGGSPCVSLSIADSYRRQHLKGESRLFFEFVRAMEECKPKHFLLENVASMSVESKNTICHFMGCQPQFIDSALFSAQERPRYYWFNFGIEREDLVGNKSYSIKLPKDKGIVLRDIMESNVPEKYFYNFPLENIDMSKQVCATMVCNNHEMHKRVFNPAFKVHTLTCCRGGGLQKKVLDNGRARKLTPLEYERLQTLPDNWTANGVSGKICDSHRYNTCGNGWTVDVITEIFKSLK